MHSSKDLNSPDSRPPRQIVVHGIQNEDDPTMTLIAGGLKPWSKTNHTPNDNEMVDAQEIVKQINKTSDNESEERRKKQKESS